MGLSRERRHSAIAPPISLNRLLELFAGASAETATQLVAGDFHLVNPSVTVSSLKPMMALWRCRFPCGVVCHSDRGSQYCSEDYQKTLKAYGKIFTGKTLAAANLSTGASLK